MPGAKKVSGYNVTGHCGKYMWIRIAILEKLMVKIVEDLKANARYFTTNIKSWIMFSYHLQ